VGCGWSEYLVVLTSVYVPASAFKIFCSRGRFSELVSLRGSAVASDAHVVSVTSRLPRNILADE
jgi:hypothetical protein